MSSIEFKNLEELSKMQNLKPYLTKHIKAELQELNQAWVDDCKSNTPVQTGKMRESWNNDGVHITNENITLSVSNKMEYAPHVEYGHRIRRNGKYVGIVKGQYIARNGRRRTYAKIPEALTTAFQKAFDELG